MPGPACDWSWVSVDLEITNRCQNRCILCPRERLSRHLGDMSRETFDTVSTLLATCRSLVSLSGMGDPLLHPEVILFSRMLREKGADVRIVVHASSLVRGAAVETLVQARPHAVLVSFPSCHRDLFETLCPGVDYDQALSSVRSLARAAAGRFGIRIAGILTRQNPRETEEFRGFWKEMGLAAHMAPCHGRGGHLRASEFYAPDERRWAAEPCGLFRFHTFVTWEADVLACCHDLTGETRLGNLVGDSMEAIASRKEQIAHSLQPFDLCARCDEPLRKAGPVRGAPPKNKKERREFFRNLRKRGIRT